MCLDQAVLCDPAILQLKLGTACPQWLALGTYQPIIGWGYTAVRHVSYFSDEHGSDS